MNQLFSALGVSASQLLWLAVMFGIVFLAVTAVWISEIVDVVRREFPSPSHKIAWLLVLIFSHGLGALLYLTIGRKQGRLPGRR